MASQHDHAKAELEELWEKVAKQFGFEELKEELEKTIEVPKIMEESPNEKLRIHNTSTTGAPRAPGMPLNAPSLLAPTSDPRIVAIAAPTAPVPDHRREVAAAREVAEAERALAAAEAEEAAAAREVAKAARAAAAACFALESFLRARSRSRSRSPARE